MFFKQRKWGIPFFLATLLVGIFCLNTTQISTATEDSIKIPEKSEDFKNAGGNFMSAFPDALDDAWKEAMMFWNRIGLRLKDFWDSAIKDRFEKLIDRFNAIVGRVRTNREPIIKDEFEKEKIEMKESVNKDLPPITKSIWEKIRGLFSR